MIIPVGLDSEVVVAHGLPHPLLPDRPGRRLVAILTQPGPPSRLAHRSAEDLPDASVLEVPDREEAKTLRQVGLVYDWLHGINLGRDDTVVGVGGGALTDLAGFVAATWLRGVESVMVPTTLLGAVDAAIGGKTGINHAGKNLVGAFWPPRRVIVDLDVLDRLPRPLRLEGSAEILKTGFISDPSILDEYRRSGLDANLDEVVPKAIAVKAEVVSSDLREAGRRAILNFGHTVGHVVETLTGIPHGHAVAVGMVAAAAVSERRHGFDPLQVTELLRDVGLPTVSPRIDPVAATELLWRDKKRTAQGIRMVLLRAIGDPVVETVDTDDIERALGAVGIGRG